MIAQLKPYATMKDSGVRWLEDVPDHWGVQRLRHVAELRVSNVDKHTREGEQPVRLCNYTDVYKHDRIVESMPFMRASASADEIARFRLAAGDVLITKDSETWNDIGIPALVELSANDLISGYHLALLRAYEDKFSGRYLFRAFQSRAVAYQLHVQANGVTRFGLSHDAIKSVVLPHPPPAEQADIVCFLDYVDRRIGRYVRAKQRLIQLLDEQKQAIIHSAVTRGLNPDVQLKPSEAEWLGMVPEHWEVRRAKGLFRELDHRSVSGTEVLLSLRMYRGLVPHSEVSVVPITADALIGYKKVERGQIVMNRMRAAIGMFGIATQPGIVSPDYAILEPITTTIDPEYFLQLFKTPAAGTAFRIESKGLGTGSSGFMRLYMDRFGMIKMPVPPEQEQRRIVGAIVESTREIQRTEDRLVGEVSLVDEYRTRLIADVVTGKLDVRGAAAQISDDDLGREPLNGSAATDFMADALDPNVEEITA